MSESDASFISRCEMQIYHDGIDLDDGDGLRLFRLAGRVGEPPDCRIAWPPYAEMIEDARHVCATTAHQTPAAMGRARAGRPIGVDVFDAERQAFLRALAAFSQDPSVSAAMKRDEVEATVRAVRHIAWLHGASHA
jgi:hypothetical protein